MPKPFHSRQRPPREHRPGRGGPPARTSARPTPPNASTTNWDHVANWYDKLVGDEGSDYHRNVLLPAALRLLDVKPGQRVLDLCCGQGVFCRLVAQKKPALVLGVDASGKLIAAAKAREPATNIRYVVADARKLGDLADGTFDSAACLMAVHDLDPVGPMFAEMSKALRVGGRAVVIFMHPCFHIPRQSSWGWDEQRKIQFRRLDRYDCQLSIPIATHPGSEPGQHTVFFHRPLAQYVNELSDAGLLVDRCEELLSHRVSEPGGHSRGENRSREEFPVFLALRGVKASHPK